MDGQGTLAQALETLGTCGGYREGTPEARPPLFQDILLKLQLVVVYLILCKLFLLKFSPMAQKVII